MGIKIIMPKASARNPVGTPPGRKQRTVAVSTVDWIDNNRVLGLRTDFFADFSVDPRTRDSLLVARGEDLPNPPARLV